MFFTQALSTLALASTALGAYIPQLATRNHNHETRDLGCGSDTITAELHDFLHKNYVEFKAKEAKAASAELVVPEKREVYRVPIYFHVFTNSTGYGSMNMYNITGQVDALNKAFAPADIQFDYRESWVVQDDKLCKGTMDDVTQYRLGGDDYRTLNIYIQQLDGLAGEASYPEASNVTETIIKRDGVRIASEAFFGGPLRPRGTTVIHEVGHWFSLAHTFQDGCDADGDKIDDTPAHLAPTGEDRTTCPAIGPDTCPGAPGRDPIKNYMNYSSDECRDEFTPGQYSAMRAAYEKLRSTKPGAGKQLPGVFTKRSQLGQRRRLL